MSAQTISRGVIRKENNLRSVISVEMIDLSTNNTIPESTQNIVYENISSVSNGEGKQLESDDKDSDIDEISKIDDTTKCAKLYSCMTCGKMFAKKPYAKRHCQTKPVWKCELCGTEIKQSCNIKRHQSRCPKEKITPEKSVKQVKATKCVDCSKEFQNEYTLLRHMKIKHQLVSFKKIVCQVKMCPFTTDHKNRLKTHVTEEHTSKSVTCDQCEFVCFTKSGLGRHMKTNHGKECEVCS